MRALLVAHRYKFGEGLTMKSHLWKALLSLFLLFGVVVSSGQLAGGQTAPQSSALTAQASAKDPLADLSSCVQAGAPLQVLFLVDTSASLPRTDPKDQRVTAAKAAMASLAAFGSTNESLPDSVEVQIAAFSDVYAVVTPWVSLNQGSVAGVQGSLETFADKDDGIDTDFATALVAARADLAQQAKAKPGPDGVAPCQLLLLFTDGKFDIEPRTGRYSSRSGDRKEWAPDIDLASPDNKATIEKIGRDVLCAKNGEADVLRVDGVTTVVIALSPDIKPEDQDFISSIAVGSTGAASCGDVAARGSYLAASDIGSLIGIFNSSANRVAGGTQLPGNELVSVCAGAPCPQGTRTFTSSIAMSRVSVLADFGSTSGKLVLQGPSGPPTEISPTSTSTTASGAKVVPSWIAPAVLSLDIQFANASTDWIGQWSLSLVADSVAQGGHLQMFAYTDLRSEFVGEARFDLGETSPVKFKIASTSGRDVAKATSGSDLSLKATVIGSPGATPTEIPLTQGADGTWSGSYFVPDTTRVSEVVLKSDLRLTTSTGLSMVPVETRTQVKVKKPASYPQITSESLDMGSVEGKGTAKGFIEITGGEVDGAVFLDDPTFTLVPREFEDVTPVWIGSNDPIEIPAGSKARVEVTFKLPTSADGTVRGNIPVTLSSSDRPDKQLFTDLPLQFDTVYSVDGLKQFFYFILLLLAGLLIPLTLMWIGNWKQARFQDRDRLRGTRIPVVIHPDGSISRRGEDGSAQGPIQTSPDDWKNMGNAGQLRAFEWSGLKFQASVPKFPIGEPYGMVTASGTHLVGSGTGGSGRRGTSAVVELTLVDTWVFVLHGESQLASAAMSDEWGSGSVELNQSESSNSQTTISGEIIVFAMVGGEESRVERLAVSQTDGIAAAAQKLAETVRAHAPKPDRLVAAGGGSPSLSTSDSGSLDWDQPSSSARGSVTVENWDAPPASTPSDPPSSAPNSNSDWSSPNSTGSKNSWGSDIDTPDY
jgi:hypothetical protein